MSVVQGRDVEHVLIDRGGAPIRLDVVEGTMADGPAALHFELANDDRLELRIAVIRALNAAKTAQQRHVQLGRRLLALQAKDVRDAGASLRETADLVLEPGAWPGDGEHRKSLIRRMLVAGEQMVRAGPIAILSGQATCR